MGSGSLGIEIIFKKRGDSNADCKGHHDQTHEPEREKYIEELPQTVNFETPNLRRKISYSVILPNIFHIKLLCNECHDYSSYCKVKRLYPDSNCSNMIQQLTRCSGEN
jgi:hypothetical protein